MCQRNVPTRSVSEEHRLRPFRMPDSRRGNNPMNRLRSLRDYVDRLTALGEIQEIDVEVDWNLEMGAIVRRCYELQAPAPLFNRIRGIEPGFRVLGALVSAMTYRDRPILPVVAAGEPTEENPTCWGLTVSA